MRNMAQRSSTQASDMVCLMAQSRHSDSDSYYAQMVCRIVRSGVLHGTEFHVFNKAETDCHRFFYAHSTHSANSFWLIPLILRTFHVLSTKCLTIYDNVLLFVYG